MSLPTVSEEYSKLLEHLRLAQECALMLKHLRAAEGDGAGLVIAQGWFNVAEGLKQMQHIVTQLAMGRLN